jgi:hypothetical protein
LNWSKGLIVKERILIHLSPYTSYSDQNEVPEAITQQGIADSISAPRPHISIALKDLRTNNQVTEQMCRVIHGKRKQKVYFLSGTGVQMALGLKRQIMDTKIKLLSGGTQEQITIAQAITRSQLSLFELLNNVTSEGEVNLDKVVKEQRPKTSVPYSATEMGSQESTQTDDSTTITPRSDKHDTDGERIPTPSPSESRPHPQMGSTLPTARDHDATVAGTETPPPPQQHARDLNYSQHPNYPNYPEGYEYSQRVQPIFASPFFKTAWLSLVVVSISLIIFIILYGIFKPEVSYYDLGLWIVILISLLCLGQFGTFIPLNHRAQVLTAIGIIIIINASISLFVDLLDGYDTTFWIFSGVMCNYLSFSLLVNQNKDLFSGIGLGFGLGIIIGSILFLNFFEFTDVLSHSILILISTSLWMIIAIFLLAQTSQAFKGKSDIENTIRFLYFSLPIIIGLVLIFFGIYLIRYEKLMEIVIEIFLGIIVIIYGIPRLRDFGWPQIVNGVLVFIAIIVSFTVILLL